MTNEVSTTVESFSLPCAPENEDFVPSAEELENFYTMLETGTIPELDWKCPGRRAPSPIGGTEEHANAVESAEKEA